MTPPEYTFIGRTVLSGASCQLTMRGINGTSEKFTETCMMLPGELPSLWLETSVRAAVEPGSGG